ncbi:alcohol dehydrogenase catalytic domain-containing protein [Rhodobacter sphaeroides]|mgnify:CR=1 FL=1|jgi:Threonine dehydrogenase and related Zn-dependent dehydrogenases|uniref:Zn-dependent dehydrogenase n=1 Tax=Cereibacter sphaeroides (strain ATCC 17023 / DSM 158 / JCM 6121 / CCUG 31486 / LMG 2827 / NBRC 12203 / NCIMB 8253 / ATH 2.4.1.) TaxID=272943 RepID=Q3J631_CERS4|nr:zinc-binding alcohol dehydrogenase family protein [Cereibacter sphaeroides]ABA77753.1 Putative Zn-dependent dehydrogenase [Cereibacter sphaeroides 2.4.1]AMJ46153.1 dehydrogenase [Cereibacter sphaeroides]ANS32865.1 dehydrogenase [Cereibacter sphaeroides]ATN61917.1 dehydrogenase [Cereibacter sphaeroides]AXC59999.1 dehydrogenase [Cereibacter sphaeroides 2.4.1]
MSLMKALVCVEPGRFEQQDRPRPEAKPGHIRIRILQVGICGTDYHIYGGHQPFLAYPRIMGHELSGRAMEASADGRIAEGDLVVINPYLTCGTCRACRAGKPNCCENIAVLGVHTDGGMCEEIVVPEGNVYGAEGLTEQSAAMVEFLAIGAHGVRRGGVRAGSAALVVGAGPIGIGAALFAAIEGAAVTLRDTSASRLALAQKVLLEARIELVGEEAAEVYDTVFDATGNIRAMNAGLQYVGHGGAYVLLSVVKGDLSFADPEFHKREATLFASRNALKKDFEHVIAQIRNGRVPVEALATHATSFEDAVTNLPLWAEDRGTLIKAIIRV